MKFYSQHLYFYRIHSPILSSINYSTGLPKYLISWNCKSPLPRLLKFFKFQDLGFSVHHICSRSKLQAAAPNKLLAKFAITISSTNVFGINMDRLYVRGVYHHPSGTKKIRNFLVTPTPSTFSKVLPDKWEAHCRTNGRRTAVQMGGDCWVSLY